MTIILYHSYGTQKQALDIILVLLFNQQEWENWKVDGMWIKEEGQSITNTYLA